MSLASVALATAVVAGALVVLGAARPVTADADMAQKYFGCPTGYTFQTSGNNARCYYAGVSATDKIQCGIAYVKAIDQFNGGKDGCQNKASNVVGNYTCPDGFSPKVQPGPDVCLKPATPSILAPSVEKSL